MNTPNPLSPQGSLLEKQAKSKSSLQAAALIVGLHVVVLGGLLISGCDKDKTKTETAGVTDSLSNTNAAPLLPDTNAPAIGTTVPTNSLPPGISLASTSAPPIAVLPPVTNPPVTTEPTTLPAATGNASEYKIQKGDIAYNLAKKHGVTLKALKEANPSVDLGKLKVGQTIQIPGGGAEAKPEHGGIASAESGASGETTTYTVKGGDTLGKIAKKHGTTVKAIRSANGLKSNDIKVGQKLKLPVKPAGAEPSPAPTPAAVTSPASAPLPTATPVSPANTPINPGLPK